MKCAWDELLGILPIWLRQEVNLMGRESLQELRLRMEQPPELVFRDRCSWLTRTISHSDLDFCINSASRYSPWSADTAGMGYLTAPGGHRIGICGEMIMRDGIVMGCRKPRSLCIRVARDFPGIAEKAKSCRGSVLIVGAPGWGKTTLLRDYIRQRSMSETVAVVDERGELFPHETEGRMQIDVLTGCPKGQGILQLLKTMGPQVIAVDEITCPEDCKALKQADCCGVSLLATAHASGPQDLKAREIYREILPVFDYLFLLHADQTFEVERMIP